MTLLCTDITSKLQPRDHIKYSPSTCHAILSSTRSTRYVAVMDALYRLIHPMFTFVHTRVVPHRSASPGSSLVSCYRCRRTHVKKIEKIEFDVRLVRKKFFTSSRVVVRSCWSVWELRKQLTNRVCGKWLCLDEFAYVFERCCVPKIRKFQNISFFVRKIQFLSGRVRIKI